MKLKEVTHTENFCGTMQTDEFNICNNRFVLFDKLGRKLSDWAVSTIPNYLELEVLETVESAYDDLHYFVGFPTTHIKLDILDDRLLSIEKDKFGDVIYG